MINDYIAVDVETTGLNPAKDKLLEIGAVKVCKGEICETYGTLVDAGIPVCGFARLRGNLETLFMQITDKDEKVVLIHEG